jgi:hypothetical protein
LGLISKIRGDLSLSGLFSRQVYLQKVNSRLQDRGIIVTAWQQKEAWFQSKQLRKRQKQI